MSATLTANLRAAVNRARYREAIIELYPVLPSGQTPDLLMLARGDQSLRFSAKTRRG